MKRLVHFIRRTRRFRYTLMMLLVFGALFAVTQTQSQEDEPAEELSTRAETTTAGDNSESATEGNVPTQVGQPEGKAPVSSESESVLRQKAIHLLEGLSARVSSDSTAADAVIPGEILELVYSGDASGADEGMYATLSDAETAGALIHELRLRGFVPMKSLRWINPVADAALESSNNDAADQKDNVADAMLMAIITVDDKRNPNVPNWEPRHRAAKIHFKQSGDDLLISDMVSPTVRDLGGIAYVEGFIRKLQNGQADEAWQSGSKLMQAKRDAEALHADLKSAGFIDATSIEWGEETAIEGGFKLRGTLDLGDEKSLPFYVALLETEEGLKVLDLQMTDSFLGRIFGERGDTLDRVVAVIVLALLLGFIYIIISYVKGLWGSPRELYILFFTKVTEFSAYGAAQLTFMFYLRDDLGLGDIGAGTYYSSWSTIVTATTMVVGAICDAIGIKKTLLIGSVLLLFSRAFMPLSDDLLLVTLFGFIPLGIGAAITGPVLSVGIKRYTTVAAAALGFGLFYTLINVGWAIGAWIFDFVRINMGDRGSLEFLGSSLSTWQVLFGIGFFINVPDLLAIMWMRDGVEMTEGGVKIPAKKQSNGGADGPTRSLLARSMASIKAGAVGSAKVFRDNFIQRSFWVFILLIGITVFARLTFFHFHITWPSYGIRYFGEGSLVGNVFGILNPIIIVFLVPVIAYLTRNVSSYWMLLIGTVVSVVSVAIVVLPPELFAWMENTWFGIIVYERWLEVPVGNRDPYYLSMVLFVTVFTIGEAIWAPRLMQFTAEIAPPGREGSYISLSYLPYFGAKFIVGPMAGMLLSNYSPEFGVDGIYGYYPDHQLIWWWIGGSAALTPLGLLAFRKLYRIAEISAADAAKLAVEEEASESHSG